MKALLPSLRSASQHARQHLGIQGRTRHSNTSLSLINHRRRFLSMAATAMMQIQPDLKPVAGLSNLTPEAVSEVSRLMQKNHDDHHAFFNDMGFHDHIAHQMLSMYANGATPAQMNAQFQHNSVYQRPVNSGKKALSSDAVDLTTTSGFLQGLGRHSQYGNYLNFFKTEIQAKGVDSVLDEYLFDDNERARALFTRINCSIIHPIIHLGLAIEFNLPGMVAEALSWTAIHPDELGSFNKAVTSKLTGPDPNASLLDLYLELGQHRDAAQQALPFNSPFSPHRYDKILAINNGAIASIVAKYRVTEANVEARIHEAINIEAFVALASQRRPFVPKIDFFLVHSLNGTVYLPALLKSLGPKKAARLVEHQIHACLVDYTTIGAPELDPEYLHTFLQNPSKQPGTAAHRTWEELFGKSNAIDDDGHVSKAMRALKGAEGAAGRQTRFAEALKKEDFLGLANLVLKSCEEEPDFVNLEGPTNQWVRKAGFLEAWEGQKIEKVE